MFQRSLSLLIIIKKVIIIIINPNNQICEKKYNYTEYHPIRKFKMPEPYLWPDNVNNVAYNPWTDLRWRRDVAKLKLKFPWERIPSISDRYIYFIFINVYMRASTVFLNHFPIIRFQRSMGN